MRHKLKRKTQGHFCEKTQNSSQIQKKLKSKSKKLKNRQLQLRWVAKKTSKKNPWLDWSNWWLRCCLMFVIILFWASNKKLRTVRRSSNTQNITTNNHVTTSNPSHVPSHSISLFFAYHWPGLTRLMHSLHVNEVSYWFTHQEPGQFLFWWVITM